MAYTLIRFHVFFRGADGAVLKQGAGRIDYIHPQQTLGIVSYYPENDLEQVVSLDIQFFPEDTSEMVPLAGTFMATDVTMVADAQSTTARATIVSTFTQPVTSVPVMAVVYDEHNNIVGGGFDDSVAATGNAAVEIPLFVAGEPARVEVYPGVDTASTIDGEAVVEMG